MSQTLEIEIDADLLALVDERATRLGKPRRDVVADALRRGLEGGRLSQILDANRNEADLSEDEAMELAIAEVKAMRSERASANHE
jgi:hypothetical protein